MSERSFAHVAANPIPGDIVEIVETDTDGEATHEIMLRVLVVLEDHVGFKEYGKGRYWLHLPTWRKRLGAARLGKLYRAGDQDCPF